MKKILFTFLFLIGISGTILSQSLGVFVGYGTSVFGDDFFGDGEGSEQAKYIPVGGHILFGTGGALEFGAEIDYSIVPFTFSAGEFGDLKVNQLYYGALVKMSFGHGGITPFARAGGGMYTGKVEIDYSDEWNDAGIEDSEMDLKSAFGYNVGGGLDMNINHNTGLFAEFVYHFVDREADVDEVDGEDNSFKANNWAVHIGIQFGL